MNATINEQEIESSIMPVVNQVRELQITDNETYLISADLLKEVAIRRQQVADAFNDLIAEANRHHKNLIAKRNKYDAPLLSAESQLKRIRVAYIQEQERKRREEEQALQAKLRKQEEDRRIAEAAALEDAGMQADGLSVLDEPQHQIAVVMPPPVPKVDGISHREQWSAEVTNMLELIKGIVDGTVPVIAVMPNQTFLNQQARSLKSLLQYPGVKAVSNTVESVKP